MKVKVGTNQPVAAGACMACALQHQMATTETAVVTLRTKKPCFSRPWMRPGACLPVAAIVRGVFAVGEGCARLPNAKAVPHFLARPRALRTHARARMLAPQCFR